MTNKEKLLQLISTGEVENVNLAFELAKSQNITVESLFDVECPKGIVAKINTDYNRAALIEINFVKTI